MELKMQSALLQLPEPGKLFEYVETYIRTNLFLSKGYDNKFRSLSTLQLQAMKVLGVFRRIWISQSVRGFHKPLPNYLYMKQTPED